MRALKIDKNVVLVSHRVLEDGYLVSSVKHRNKFYYYLYKNTLTGRKLVFAIEVEVK